MMKILIIVIVCVETYQILADEICGGVNGLCGEQVNCQECIRAHYCCVWCYNVSYSGRRCFSNTNTVLVEQCTASFIENNTPTRTTIQKDANFTDVQNDVDKAIQFIPREFNIDLRHGDPVNITISYRPSKNYPLDLYYLMDLTKSMQPQLDTLKELGSELTKLLKKLTKNYRIAFGSYIDKPELPFYRTDPVNFENPCSSDYDTCEKGYLFKHKLNFTNDIDMFIKEVNASRVSANSDNLEGGMDALMQIVLCQRQMDWLEDSRKLIIIATEGGMHFAGDGILAGHTPRNVDRCLMNENGIYSSPIRFDYPSLEEVHHQLKNKKTNVIMAAKSSILDYYTNMGNVLKESLFIGELKTESSDVLDLTRNGYYAFLKQVNLFTNITDINGLDVTFFSDCDGNGKWKKGGSCSNAEEGKEMKFKVQFQLNQYQENGSMVLNIEENNINDKIKVNLNFVGSTCACKHLPEKMNNKNCNHGRSVCGECICEDGWSGEFCNATCRNNYQSCRFDDRGSISLTCSGRGQCICGKCRCDSPRFQGHFCQFECPYEKWTGKICSGHGDCINGTCVCEAAYEGNECACEISKEKCKIPGTDNMCNWKGTCECNKCHCNTGFSGDYCEKCDDCTGLCNYYESYVVNRVIFDKSPTENGNVSVEMVEDIPLLERGCVYIYENKQINKKCNIFYKYAINQDRVITITTMKPVCNEPIAASALVGIIIGAILAAGLLFILVWKARNWQLDKREYEKFLKESHGKDFHREENPLYRTPYVTYNNPLRESIEMKSFHDKK